MVVSCITFWNYWEMHATVALANLPFTGGDQAHTWSLFFKAFIDLIILIDVTIASLGYLTSCRLLDTQFTSVEPTVSGWVVALICYPPFNILFEAMLGNSLLMNLLKRFMFLILLFRFSWPAPLLF